MDFLADIQAITGKNNAVADEPMAKHTTFRVGGAAKYAAFVSTASEIESLIKLCNDNNVQYYIIGNGSNVLISDKGYDGLMIIIGRNMSEISVEGETIRAGAGALLSAIGSKALNAGLAGFEFACGIPGTLGGACFMNAGAYGGEMKDVVESVTLMKSDGSSVYELSGEEMEFAYRDSVLQHNDDIAIYARVRLQRDDKEAITERMNELAEKRRTKQPVNFPSAGSTFKRPVGGYAAALIEEAGLKGRTVGGAQVSEKHSGFVINIGGATSKDVRELIDIVAQEVEQNSGIKLEPEVRIIDAE